MGRGDMGCAVGAQSSRTLLGNGRARARRPAPACVRATEGRGTPMSGAGLALRRALVAALRADVELAGQLSGVFDAPPQGQAYPYLSFGPEVMSDAGHKTGEGHLHSSEEHKTELPA